MIHWRCVSCGHRTYLPPEMAGETVVCPKCKAVSVVPGGVEERKGKLAQAARLGAREGDGQKKISLKPVLIAGIILAVGMAIVVLVLVLVGGDGK